MVRCCRTIGLQPLSTVDAASAGAAALKAAIHLTNASFVVLAEFALADRCAAPGHYVQVG